MRGARPISTKYLSRASLERFVILFWIFNCLILYGLSFLTTWLSVIFDKKHLKSIAKLQKITIRWSIYCFNFCIKNVKCELSFSCFKHTVKHLSLSQLEALRLPLSRVPFLVRMENGGYRRDKVGDFARRFRRDWTTKSPILSSCLWLSVRRRMFGIRCMAGRVLQNGDISVGK